ncbi:ROK family transcriptional regulator [Sphaerisporangium sp. NPDC051017]|uniref:ROK family transcriptional regulator n=1 Tax=Sphaerisporangium sp. NPDC051017 TaxID=3154636 RepID=UPI00343108EC
MASDGPRRSGDGGPGHGDRPERARNARWRTAADVLARVRGEPGITRAELARRLNLTTGSATEITARLRELCLLGEVPAPARGRGRPTTVLAPHPSGPLVLAIDLRQEDWRCGLASLDGRVHDLREGRHAGREPGAVLGVLGEVVSDAWRRHGDRLRAVSLAVPATVQDGRIVQASALGWGPVDLGALAAGSGLPLLVGNDATLAGVAEACTGAAAGAGTALHLLVEVGVGGALIVGGRPVTGAGGTGGEYGHVPFGDRALRCPCGARGCWDLEVDGRALARHLGAPAPRDPRTYARRVLARVAGGEAAGESLGDVPGEEAARAVGLVAESLAAGIAGLVNAHAPDVVTLGGLAVHLRAAASARFGAAYEDGLMSFRRDRPPPVLDAAHGDDGALHGAVAVGLDHVTSEAALAAWAEGSPAP